MSQGDVLTIMRDAIFTVIAAAAPMLIVAIVVGLLVSIFQATTQINEQTIAFVPKIVAVFLALLIFGGYVINQLTGFFTRLLETMNSIISF